MTKVIIIIVANVLNVINVIIQPIEHQKFIIISAIIVSAKHLHHQLLKFLINLYFKVIQKLSIFI